MGYLVLAVVAVMLARAFKQPSINVAIALMFFAIKQQVQLSVPFFATRSSAFNIAVFSCMSANWLYQVIVRGRAREVLRLPLLHWLHLGFIAYMMASTLWSPFAGASDRFLSMAAYLVVFSFAVPTLLSGTRGMNECFQWMAWFGGFLCLAFFLAPDQYADADRLMLEIDTGGGESMVLNPLAVGQMGALTLMAATFASFKKSLIVSMLRVVVGALAIVVTARSARGELIAAVVSVAFVGVVTMRRLRLSDSSVLSLIGVSVALVIGLGAFYLGVVETSYWQRYESLAGETGTMGRVGMLETVWEHFWSRPSIWLFGDGFAAIMGTYGFYPHNAPIQALAELGFFGFGIWVASVVGVFVSGMRAVLNDRNQPEETGAAVSCSLAVLVCLFVVNLKEGESLNMWLTLAVCALAQVVHDTSDVEAG